MTNNLFNNHLSLLQWNCHGILNKRETFIQIANQHDILALSETWLTPDKGFFLNGYHILRHDGLSNKSGGVLLAIKDTIPFEKIDSLFTLDGVLKAVGTRIPTMNNHIYIISIYRHPGRHDSSFWDRLFNSIPASTQTIVTRDFNAHHVSWGCNHSDFMGRSLLESSQESSLFPINDGTPTYISYFSRTSSVIDLTFVSSDLTLYCTWKPFDDTLGSDHIPASITISYPVKTRTFFSHRLQTSKINHKKLFASFLNYLPVLSHSLEADNISPVEKYNIFCNFLKDVIISLLPERKSTNNSSYANHHTRNKNNGNNTRQSFPPAPWWNEDCNMAVELRKQALRTFHNNPSRANYLSLKKQEALTKKTLRQSKRKG